MSRPGCSIALSCFIALAVLLLPAAAPGALAAVERVTGASPDKVAETLSEADGRILVTLRNSGPPGEAPIALRVEPAFTPVTSGGPVAASWTRLDTNQPPEVGDRFLLAPGTTLTLAARGTFSGLGTWETAVEALGSDGTVEKRIVLAVTRAPPPAIPSTLVAEPRTARVTLGPLELGTPAGLSVRIEARNQGTQPLRLNRATVGQVSTISDPAEVSASTAAFGIASNECGSELQVGATCRVALAIPEDLGAGRYVAEIILSGEGGGESARNQTVEVRRSAWTASFICAIGAVLGALVSTWRSTGRVRVEARILAAERRRRASQLLAVATLPEAKGALESLREHLEALDASIRRGLLPPDFTLHDARLQAIAAAVDALSVVDTASPEQEAAFHGASGALRAALGEASRDGELKEEVTRAVAAAAAKLRSDAAAFHALCESVRSADRALAAVRPGLVRLLGGTALANAWQDLKEAREHAFPLPGMTAEEPVAERSAKIQRLTALLSGAAAASAVPAELLERIKQADAQQTGRHTLALQDAKELVSRWQGLPGPQRLEAANRLADEIGGGMEAVQASPGAAVPVVVAPASGMTLDFDSFLSGPVRLASLSELEHLKSAWDWLANGAVLFGIGAAAVPILWVGNPIWGTPTDLVTALLAGMGTRLAVGSAARG